LPKKTLCDQVDNVGKSLGTVGITREVGEEINEVFNHDVVGTGIVACNTEGLGKAGQSFIPCCSHNRDLITDSKVFQDIGECSH